MFYYLTGLEDFISVFNIFRYITFRAAMAAVSAFILCVIMAPLFIRYFKELKENALRKDCPDLDKFQATKQGTPTMGGIFMVGSILLSVLFWADLSNVYINLTLLVCAFLAVLGWMDDYVKLAQKGKHRGLPGRKKLFYEIVLGLAVGWYLYYFNPETSGKLDVPFLKDVVFNLGVVYIFFVALIIVGTTNAVNLTDGLDGLAAGCVMIVSLTLGILSYISGHMEFSKYLFIPYVPGAGELTVFCAAILGASLGFLWFNAHPASVFMGDVGSLSLGGSLGAIAIFIKKELLLGLLGGVFVLEALSVILQVISYKTRRKRIFKMSPFHHHLQLSGWHESKIIIRFWIIGIILALLTLTTLKIR
jgi:phospho-N-acetylmuramoyl-pentapeptide-transferase